MSRASAARFEGKMRAVIRRPALLLCAALAACAHAPADAPVRPAAAAPDPTAYFPLAVGNEWTWIDRSPQVGRRGAQAANRPHRLARRRRATSSTTRGARSRSAHGCIQDRVRRILCAPFELDRSWISIVSETSTERYQIAATGLTAAVPAGTFEGCILVRARNRAGAGRRGDPRDHLRAGRRAGPHRDLRAGGRRGRSRR